MDILIITFTLDGMTSSQYHQMADQIAPAFAEVPGLVAKTWLADDDTAVYGGVYTFTDRAALTAYLDSDLLAQAAATPGITGVTSAVYGVLDGPTTVTRGATLAVA
jgi:hypothetical protein